MTPFICIGRWVTRNPIAAGVILGTLLFVFVGCCALFTGSPLPG